MSDLIAGRPAGGEGGGGPWNEGAPPPVLLAALGAATLIAVTLVALFGGFGGGSDNDQAGPLGGADATSADGGRVQLTVSFEGSGDGEIRIRPGDISCGRPCKHDFASGTRVTVTADAASGSMFEGWRDSCDGTARCSVLMDGARSLSATFDTEPAEPAEPAEPPCDDAAAAKDPACAGEDLDAPPDEDLDAPDAATPPAADCADGRDNDRDGLTDSAQDPDCADGSAEAGSGAPGATAPPPPTNDCADGRDNDRDGLTDRAQDPDCVGGNAEAG